jgi:hypothetical protein
MTLLPFRTSAATSAVASRPRPLAEAGRRRRDPATPATFLLAVAGAALIAASAAADSNLLGDAAYSCPKCKEGVCYQEIVTYRCKQVPDNKPIKKTVYECREVPYCQHQLPHFGHRDCCPECEACPKFKKVLVKKEITVGDSCGTKCVPEKFVERIPVPCCRCGYTPPGSAPTPPGSAPTPATTDEPKAAPPQSNSPTAEKTTRRNAAYAERLPTVAPSTTLPATTLTVPAGGQLTSSARRSAETTSADRPPRHDDRHELTSVNSVTIKMDETTKIDVADTIHSRKERLPATDSMKNAAVRRSFRDDQPSASNPPIEGRLIRLTPPDAR